MGTASVLKLVDSNLRVIREEDFDKALNGELSEIAFSLPREHPFHRLMVTLDAGADDEDLPQRMESVAGEDAQEMGFMAVAPRQIAVFRDYVCGEIESQWNDLFPGRARGWLRYQLLYKRIERAYKEKPSGPGEAWLRDDYGTLLGMIRQAIDKNCHVLRILY